MVAYRVLSIYRVLPGFREFAVFEKIKRFFYIFFGWVLHRCPGSALLLLWVLRRTTLTYSGDYRSSAG